MGSSRNRVAGHNLERQYCNELKSIGFTNVCTTRNESRRLDAAKVDLFDLDGDFPYYVQVKNKITTLNYHKMFEDETRDRKRPYIIMHKKTEKRGKRFMTVGEYVIMEKETFYKLLKKKEDDV